MHVSLDSALGRQRRLNSVGESVLQIAPSAAAAYSLRSLTGGDPKVVRVRRSSNDAEQDFTASGVSSGALTSFVNEDVITEQSDFTSGVDGYAKDSHGTVTREASFEGESDVIKYNIDGGRFAIRNASVLLDYSSSYQITFEYYADSEYNNKFWGIEGAFANIAAASSNTPTVVSGAWNTATLNVPSGRTAGTTSLKIRIQDDTSASYGTTTQANVRFKNIVVTQLTGSGFVETWYDQSGNSKDAVQETAGSQPKIVNAGSLVVLSGVPALSFDGSSFVATGFAFSPSGDFLAVTVSKISTGNLLDTRDGGNDGLFIQQGGSDVKYRYNGDGSIDVSGNNQHTISTVELNGTTLTAYKDGSSAGTDTVTAGLSTTEALSIGKVAFSSANTVSGSVQEIILYDTDKSANRAALETNIISHYGIS